MADTTLLNFNFSDVNNWRAGYYDARNGSYKTDLSYYICTNELIPAEPNTTYQVKYTNTKYSLNITAFDANKKYINNTVLFSGNSKTTTKSNVRYVGISLTDYKPTSKPDTYFKAIKSGLKITVTATTAEVKPAIVYEKVNYGDKDPATMTIEEKKDFIFGLFDTMIDNGNNNHYDISALKLNYKEYIDPWFKEWQLPLDRRIKLSCMANPFIIYDGNTKTGDATHLYIMEAGNYKTIYAKATKIINDIASVIKNMPTDLDKILYVHEYLVANTTYNSSIAGAGRGGCLLGQKQGMCAGFADAMTLILLTVGVETGSYNSTPMNHEWNMIPLDGAYYHIDACWDNTRSKNDHYSHRYFMRTDKEMKTVTPTHYSFYAKKPYPSVDSEAAGVKAAVSPRFSNSFIHTVQGRMWYHDTLWYYYDVDTNSIIARELEGDTMKVILHSDVLPITLTNVTDGVLNFTLNKVKYSITL